VAARLYVFRDLGRPSRGEAMSVRLARTLSSTCSTMPRSSYSPVCTSREVRRCGQTGDEITRLQKVFLVQAAAWGKRLIMESVRVRPEPGVPAKIN
jgi:hypothetical protein